MHVRALVVLSFPTVLDPFDRRELAATLAELGQKIAAGTTFGGTVIVPCPRRVIMNVTFNLTGPKGPMFDQVNTYHGLPPDYAADIAAVCQKVGQKIERTQGKATGADPSYSVTLAWSGDGQTGSATKSGLLYSQATALQDDGLDAQKELVAQGKAEVKRGERK